MRAKFNPNDTTVNSRPNWRKKLDLCQDDKPHTWKKFKEREVSTNTNCLGLNRYFIVAGCTTCHTKRYLDVKVAD